jgi:hypothetical protein
MKLKVTLITLLVFTLTSGFAFASDTLISVNEQWVENDGWMMMFGDVPYGEVTEIAARMGATVSWWDDARMAVLQIGDNYITFWNDSQNATVNNKTVVLEASTHTVDGKIYAPMSFLMTQFELEYTWNADMLQADIVSDAFSVSENEIYEVSYTEEDLLWLARIVEIETGSGSVFKKSAVANVVLNRVADPRFPDNIYDVIYQRNQFPPAYYSRFATLEPSTNSYLGALRALHGIEVVPDCLYFNYIPFKDKADDFYKLIEGDYFYY